MFCCHTKYYGKVIYSMASWSDLFYLCEIDGKIVICRMGRREILLGHGPFVCLFYYEMPFPSRWRVFCHAL